MTASFKTGDKAYLGNVYGVVLGVHELEALFFVENERDNYNTVKEILNSSGEAKDKFFIFIKNHFGFYSLNDSKKSILLQKRFLVTPTDSLERSVFHPANESYSTSDTLNTLIKRRHQYLKMLRGWISNLSHEEKITRLCNRIGELQKEIEILENTSQKSKTRSLVCAYD